MPTVIDSLVLELGLDSSKFKSGESEISRELSKLRLEGEHAGKEVEAQGRKTADVILDLKREALGLLAIFLGGRGVKEFVGYVTSIEAGTGRLSKTLDMSARTVSAWQGAFQQIGGTAEGANAALQGLSGEMNRFQITGQSTIMPVLSRLGIYLYDQNHNLKTSGQLWLELADAVQGMDPRQATAFLQMIPGANQDMINFALLGSRAMRAYLTEADKAWAVTQKDIQAAQEFQRELSLLERSATGLGATFLTMVEPSITRVINRLRETLGLYKDVQDQATGNEKTGRTPDPAGAAQRVIAGISQTAMNSLKAEFGIDFEAMATWLEEKTGGGLSAVLGKGDDRSAAVSALARALRIRAESPPSATDQKATSTGYDVPTQEIEQKIRAAAILRGIDPQIAVNAAKGEGLYSYKSAVPGEESYGPFQFHYGGRGQRGALAKPGMGDDFTRDTGLHAEDPATVDAQIAYFLDHIAKTHSWAPLSSWKGPANAGLTNARPVGMMPIGAAPAAALPSASSLPPNAMQPGAKTVATTSNITNQNEGNRTSSTEVHIGEIKVNAPNAKDTPGSMREIGPALKRSVTAGAANYGPQ